MALLTTPKMFLIVILMQIPVSMIQASENCLDTFTGHHCRQYDLMISSHNCWSKWNSSEIEKNCSTAVTIFCDREEGISYCSMEHCQKQMFCREEWYASVMHLPTDNSVHYTHIMEDLQRLGSISDLQNGCSYPKMNCDGRRKFKFQPGISVINRTCHLDTHFVDQPDAHSERQQTFCSKQVDSEAVGSKYYGQQFELMWTEGVVFCVMISGFLLCCIIKLHMDVGTFLCDNLKKLLFLKDTAKEIRECRADHQPSEGSRDENTVFESFSNCKWLPKGQTSRLCRVQPFQYDGKEVSEMQNNILEESIHGIIAAVAQACVSTGSGIKSSRIQQETMEATFQNPAKAEVKDLRVNAETLKVSAQTTVGAEVESLLAKIGTVDITAYTSGGTEVEDLGVKKGSLEVTAQTSIIIEVENVRVNEGTEKFTARASSSTVEEDLTGKVETVEIIEQAEIYKFRSVEEFGKTTIEALHQEEVESYRTESQVIANEEELERYDESVPSDELVKEQHFGEGINIDDLNQHFLQATCKSVGDKNEDRRNDLSYYQDIHKVRKQQNQSGKVLELVKKKKSFRAEGSDARDRIVTTTAHQQWLQKNPDSDISLSFRDPALSEEKDKIATCFHEDRKWPESQPSVSVQQEFTPETNTEESVLIVSEEFLYASSLKHKEIDDKNSDKLSIITERPSDFISLESEKKKKKKALCSKLHFRITDNPLSFVSWKNSKKNAEDKIHLKEGVKLFSYRKQVISSSLRAFFETEDTSLDQNKDSSETEQQIPSDMYVTLQKENCGVEISERTVTDIDLKEKKKHHLRQILWLPRNWLPLPRLGRDALVGFVEEQIRDRHGGSTLPPAGHEELREMLRQLASDNIPGPQITMKYEMLRLCTMKSFPGQDRPFAIRIIGAGFYYAGHQDQVICYCCGNRKDNWVLGDIPLLIHKKMAPDCGFLTHNALVNVPIRKANSTESPSPAEVHLLAILRSDGSNQSDTAHGESSLMLPSSEQNRVNISNMPHQMLVTNKSSPPNQLMGSERQNVLDNPQTVSARTHSMEEPPPKYPQYAVKNVRINSFQGWPAELQQKPEEMAECGFYYAGFSDCVRCFFCGVGLRHWMSEDDPWIEHARWSTSCIYVLKMKGEEFVSLVKMAVEIAEREEAARNNGGGNQAPEHSSEAVPAVTAKEGNKGDIMPKETVVSKPEIQQPVMMSSHQMAVVRKSSHLVSSENLYVSIKNEESDPRLSFKRAFDWTIAATQNTVASTDSSTTNSSASKDITGSTGVTGGNVIGAATSTPSPGNAEIQKYLLTDAAQSVLDMGYQPKLVLRAIERVLLKKENEELTGQIIMEAVFEIEQENTVQPKPRASAQSAEGHESIGKAVKNASSEELQIDSEKIKREHRELREATLCKICLDNTISVVFLPCGHLVTCPDCAPAMRKCPICKTLIKGTVKTFYG